MRDEAPEQAEEKISTILLWNGSAAWIMNFFMPSIPSCSAFIYIHRDMSNALHVCESIIKVDQNCHHFAQKVSKNGTNNERFILLSQIRKTEPKHECDTSWMLNIETIYENRVNFIFIEMHHLSSFRHSSFYRTWKCIQRSKFFGEWKLKRLCGKVLTPAFSWFVEGFFYLLFCVAYSNWELKRTICIMYVWCVYSQKETKVRLYYCLVYVSNAVSNSIVAKTFYRSSKTVVIVVNIFVFATF